MITDIDIRSRECPFCGKKVVAFQLDEFIKEYIHLFEVIGIFSAVTLLLPQLSLGLKDIGIITFSDIQMISLYFALVFSCIIIIFLWIGIMSKIFEYHLFSPVRRFYPSQDRTWIQIRKGDSQYYFFVVCFFCLYVLISMYILSTLTLAFFIFAALFLAILIIAKIYDYLSYNEEERNQERKF